MANQLAMSKALSIQTLRDQGWSFRRIARELGIDRDTARRHVIAAAARSDTSQASMVMVAGGEDSNTAKAPIGVRSGGGISNTAKAPIGAESGAKGVEWVLNATEVMPVPEPAHPVGLRSRSECEPLRELIVQKLKQGLSSQRIYQDLVSEHGFAGKYWSVRRFVNRLAGGRALPFRRMECEPGAEAQVDFGSGAPVTGPEGRRRRPHVLRIVLSHSRKGYSEAVWRQTSDEFIRCLENAFHHFGGVPRTLVIDNLKAAVTRADWFDPELSPKVRSFAEHYGTAILPTRPYTPRHKGKIENGVGYVKGNALKGREFTSLEEQNRHLLEWETQVADQRLHGTTRQQVGKVFREVERSALLALPCDRFACFQEGRRSVHRDGHVEVNKSYYSVPPEYLGHQVWARWDGRMVRIFNLQMNPIATHAQKRPGQFSTQNPHLPAEKISGVEKGAVWLLAKAGRMGRQSELWARQMLSERGIEGLRVLQGLIGLGRRYPLAEIERACELAASHGAYRLRTIRQLIQRGTHQKQQQFEFAEEHMIIRPLSDYGQIVRASLAATA